MSEQNSTVLEHLSVPIAETAPTIEMVDVDLLKPHPRNSRTHSAKQLAMIKDNITQNGFLGSTLVDKKNQIICGHARVLAAKQAGLKKVPVIRVTHMTEAQIRAHIIADNKLALLAGWDEAILVEEFHALDELDFPLELTGFDTAEIDQMTEVIQAKKIDPADECPPVDMSVPAVSQIGDIWVMGENYLMNGDATNASHYAALMGGKKAQMVFTDSPYNVRVNGHVSSSDRFDEFPMASGEMSPAEFTSFLDSVGKNIAAVTADGAIIYMCMDWRHIRELMDGMRASFGEPKQLCVWNKDNGGMGNFYRSKHELVVVFKHGTAPHINNFGLGGKGRYRTNVWDYAGVNTFRRNRDAELAMHPTVKPTVLVADAMRDCSKRGDIILDPFMGSGTTIMAAERTRRRAYGLELDSHYVDVAIRRWQEFTGREAVHAVTGLTFNQTAIGKEA